MPQTPSSVTAPAGDITAEAIAFGAIGGAATAVDESNPLPVADKAWRGVVPLATDVAASAGRGVMIVCSAAGALSLRFADGSQASVPISTGLTLLPFAITTVQSGGTSAVANVWNLV